MNRPVLEPVDGSVNLLTHRLLTGRAERAQSQKPSCWFDRLTFFRLLASDYGQKTIYDTHSPSQCRYFRQTIKIVAVGISLATRDR
jgi:hypothetical protein